MGIYGLQHSTILQLWIKPVYCFTYGGQQLASALSFQDPSFGLQWETGNDYAHIDDEFNPNNWPEEPAACLRRRDNSQKQKDIRNAAESRVHNGETLAQIHPIYCVYDTNRVGSEELYVSTQSPTIRLMATRRRPQRFSISPKALKRPQIAAAILTVFIPLPGEYVRIPMMYCIVKSIVHSALLVCILIPDSA